jgi:hypothetical protein
MRTGENQQRTLKGSALPREGRMWTQIQILMSKSREQFYDFDDHTSHLFLLFLPSAMIASSFKMTTT